VDKITTTIRREYLKDIAAKRKRVEYREIKEYWEQRVKAVNPPFLLRLINGMSKTAPEVTVVVRKLVRNKRERRFELHLGKIIEVRNWDVQRERPTPN
jgi:hypothetical protein